MSTTKFTATTATTNILNVPKHRVAKIDSLVMDNQTTADVTVHLNRVFDPDASNGVTSPAGNTTEEVAYLTVGAGLTGSLITDEVKHIRGIGKVQAICDGTWATCRLVVGYHTE
jgi:hypothetical protein